MEVHHRLQGEAIESWQRFELRMTTTHPAQNTATLQVSTPKIRSNQTSECEESLPTTTVAMNE